MVQRGERPGFAHEPRKAVRIAGEAIGQDLQRDIAIELRVAGSEHLPHPALADRRSDLVNAESRTGRQGQGPDYRARAAVIGVIGYSLLVVGY
jgi:hypothetical protein